MRGMLDSAASTPAANTLARLNAAELVSLAQSQAARITQLEQRLAWFERQIFGSKSERLKVLEAPGQLSLGEHIAPSVAPTRTQIVSAHTRRRAAREVPDETDSVAFFDATRVPVERIELAPAGVAGLTPEQYEIIGTKVSYRLAQRPGSYVILEYVRPVIKRCTEEHTQILCAPAPAGVLAGSRAEVSFLAGLLVDKFAWHLPLYRQHQRLAAAGITVSRPWLTQLTQEAIGLLEPIYQAQLASIRESRVIAMDETPIKAGRSGHGRMRTAYFWPIYGEQHEVCFPCRPNRHKENVAQLLGGRLAAGAVLLSDGYAAYASFAKATGVKHAQCWAHARREVFEAEAAEPQRVRLALEHIAGIYAIEEQIRQRGLAGEAKRIVRLEESRPKVEAFFAFLDQQMTELALLPASPFSKALAYIHERRESLSVFLTDPDVALDTNHLERALRVIPMGRKSWMFCWSELGARDVGIVQSLIVTCRLHKIDVYTYLVDVLQRVATHPASRVAELIPRQWKSLFSANPMRSALHAINST